MNTNHPWFLPQELICGDGDCHVNQVYHYLGEGQGRLQEMVEFQLYFKD